MAPKKTAVKLNIVSEQAEPNWQVFELDLHLVLDSFNLKSKHHVEKCSDAKSNSCLRVFCCPLVVKETLHTDFKACRVSRC